MQFFAHEGEVHQDGIEATTHWLDAWYVALPVLLVVVVVAALLIYKLTKGSLAMSLLGVGLLLLIGSLFMYTSAPMIGAIALTLGLAGTLLATMLSLASSPQTPNQKKRRSGF